MADFAATTCLGTTPAKSVVHKKAVPPMIGAYFPKPDHGGTANDARKEASAPATASQVADWFDAEFSHAGGFQASPKCHDAKEISSLGHPPAVVDSLVDDVLLRRQPAGEVRGRQGILRGLLPEKETPGEVLCRVRESHCQASHAGPAGIGCGNSGPL